VFVQKLISEQLIVMFPNLNHIQVEGFVLKMFNNVNEWPQFKSTVRDLLISMKQFASTNDELYQEEKEAALKQSKQIEMARRSAIPGLIAPSQQQGM